MDNNRERNVILNELMKVVQERSKRAKTSGLSERVDAIKRYQQDRFAKTYADLLISPRYSPATKFFLTELYGPGDFSQRDAEFARVVPALVRLFPADVVSTVRELAILHALSEQLDSRMAEHLPASQVNERTYKLCWQAAGSIIERRRQIELVLSIGRSLDALTSKALLRHSLRLMRGPASAAGLSALQSTLEKGFNTFKHLRGASEFLEIVQQRESAFAKEQFS